MLITRHDEARAVLADPCRVPPPVRQDAPYATLGWLRAQVSRFASGEIHAERRRLAVRHLDGLDPARLRAAAVARTRELVDELGEAPAFTRRVAAGGAGEVVELDLVAANRDPAVFPDPERFDTGRGASPYLTFGHGVRPCPGSDAFAIAAGVVETVLQEER